LCILRPSIVTGSWKEPLPGWIDVMFGPAGLFLACGVGAMKVMIGKLHNTTDMIPVDIVCNGILAAAWRNMKLTKEEFDFPSNVIVYHIASSTVNPITWFHAQHLVPSYFVVHRPKRNFGYPGNSTFVQNRFVFNILNYSFHFIPAFFLDGWRMLQGKKPFMLRAARKLDRAMGALTHFTMNEWFFSNGTTNSLLAELSEEDKRVYFMDVKHLDWTMYLIIFLHGIRKFLLKEGEEPIKPGEKQQQKQTSWLASIMGGVRSYLVLISLGCLIYFFRAHFWLLKLRAKQLRGMVQNLLLNAPSTTTNLIK